MDKARDYLSEYAVKHYGDDINTYLSNDRGHLNIAKRNERYEIIEIKLSVSFILLDYLLENNLTFK